MQVSLTAPTPLRTIPPAQQPGLGGRGYVMAWRKWIVRGLVFAVAGILGLAALAYQHWTDPVVVRQLVVDKLAQSFVGANVSVESSRIRLLGGIVVTDLRMTRRGDLDKSDFLYVPSAIIYHDKERLVDGKLAIRKIELERPRLRVIRERDGTVNLTGLLAPPDLSQRLPTILIHQGTLIVEDRAAPVGTPPLELKDVNLKFLNDPEMTVCIEGSGISDALGTVKISGALQRDTGATTLFFDAPTIKIDSGLMQRLAGICPEAVEQARGLTGLLSLHATVTNKPETEPHWGHEVTLHLTRGRLVHGDLPFPIEELEATLTCTNGRIPRIEVRGKNGVTTLSAVVEDFVLPSNSSASPTRVCLETLFKKIDVKIENLIVGETLHRTLQDKEKLASLRSLYERYQPAGPTDVEIEYHPGGGPWRTHVVFRPRGMRLTYEKFIYTVDGMTGWIDYRSGGDEGTVYGVELIAFAEGQPVTLRAQSRGEKPAFHANIEITGKNIPLDDKLLAALEEHKIRPLAKSFHPTGQADFRATFIHTPEHEHFANHFLITFHDASVTYDRFPVRLGEVSGTLEINQPGCWEFRDFRGRHGNALFATHGRNERRADGDHVVVGIAGRNLEFDDDLRKALERLPQSVQRTWDSLHLTGRGDFEGTLHLAPTIPSEEKLPEIDITVWPRGCSIKPDFFLYALDDLTGKVHLGHERIELEGMTARHGLTRVALDQGVVELKPTKGGQGGGFRADLLSLHLNPLTVDADLLAAIPPAMARGLAALEIQGPLEVNTRLYIDSATAEHPRFYWDGAVLFRGAAIKTGVKVENVTGTIALRGWHNGQHLDGVEGNLDIREATLFGQPLRNLRGALLITEDEPDVLKLPGLMGTWFGGQVYGPMRIEFGQKVRYEMNMTAAQIRLEDFGRHNLGPKSDMSGTAVARIYLRGEGNDTSTLRGSGRIDVPNGKIDSLPPLVDLLKFLGLRWPDRTAFEEMHTSFDIEGPRAKIKQLELYGNAISLRGGRGEVALDGSDVDVDLNLDWARLGQILPAEVRWIPRDLSDMLFKVEVRGKVSDLRFAKQAVPVLTDPLKKLINGDDARSDRPLK